MYIAKLHHRQLLFDVGTYRCLSAAALSWTMVNRVKSYDVKTFIFNNPILPGVQYCYGDVIKDPDLIKSHFIFIDVDHMGIYESELYNHLENINWKGLLMMDDINEYTGLTNFWNTIKREKYDLTRKGHFSGTGLVNFE